MTLYSATITLFLVMDPLGNVPLFLSILKHVDQNRWQRIILREALFALLILTLFLFFGGYILSGMQISQPALSISGGVILFLIALKMIFPPVEVPVYHAKKAEPFIVPLAIPLLAGPSAMTIVMLLGTKNPAHNLVWFLALSVAWFFATLILVFSKFLGSVLGDRGLTALERLMGMILTTIAVQMGLNGIMQIVHGY